MLVQSAPVRETISLNPGYVRAKRLLDLSVTLLLLPFLCMVMACVALLILLDSGGPVLFRQRRVGLNGREFVCFKFRSMHVHSDDGSHRAAVQQFMSGQLLSEATRSANPYKLNGDRRITRVGRLIRKTSLDELPQFFNVLRGEMSLVGPRPPLQYEVDLYSAHDRLRLAGKPGLTGIWQVYGRSRVSFPQMVDMDVAYLREQSLRMDLKLIFLTIPVMVFGRGGA